MAELSFIPDGRTEGYQNTSIQETLSSGSQNEGMSLSQYRNLFNISPDPALVFTMTGDASVGLDLVCIAANRAAARFFSVDESSLAGLPLAKLPLPFPLAVASGILLQALLSGEETSMDDSEKDFRAVPLDGETVAFIVHDMAEPPAYKKRRAADFPSHKGVGAPRGQDVITAELVSGAARLLADFSLEMQEQCEALLEFLAGFTKSPHGIISFRDPATGEMKVYSEIMPVTPAGSFPGMIGRLVVKTRPLYTNELKSSGLIEGFDADDISSFLFAPVVVEDSSTGFIALAGSALGYSDAMLEAFMTFSRLYAVVLREWKYRCIIDERELKYRSLMENAPVLILSLDPEDEIIDCNPYVNTLLGYTPAQLYGKPVFSIIHPDCLADVREALHDVVARRSARTFECRLVSRAGRAADVIIGISGRAAVGPVNSQVTVICQDIAMQKANELALAVSEEKFRVISEQALMGILVLQENRIIYANDAFSRMTEYPLEELFSWEEFEYSKIVEPEFLHFVVIQAGETQGENPGGAALPEKRFAFLGTTRSGKKKWFEVFSRGINYLGGRASLLSIMDVTERVSAETQLRVSLQEKEVLLKEIHHRVKNNLQVISSLLNLQAQHIKNKKLNEMFRESQHRIKAMALIHEKLYSSDSLVDINFPDYMRTLSMFLLRSYQVRTRDIELVIEIEEISLGIDFAVPCGIILNEILSNAFKYAFPDDFSGAKKVSVRLTKQPHNLIEFVIEDTGVGLPGDMERPGTTSLGLELVKILAEGQLDGTIDISRANGTRFKIVFPWKK